VLIIHRLSTTVLLVVEAMCPYIKYYGTEAMRSYDDTIAYIQYS